MSEQETIKSRYIPKEGEWFYLVNGHGHIIQEPWHSTESNWDCWRWGNVFRSEEEAVYNRDEHRQVNLRRFL